MKFYVLIAMAIASKAYSANAVLPEVPFKKIPCEKYVVETVQAEFAGKNPEWHRVIDADSMTKTFRAAKKTGQWYELHIAERNEAKLFYISSEKSKDYIWNTKSCAKPEVREGRGLVLFEQDKKRPIDSFTDQDLAKLLETKAKGIIYLWSPKMVYSMTEFRLFRDVAKKKNLDFIAVLDPSVDLKEAKAAAKKINVDFKGRKLASVDLYMMEGTLHYPSVFVFGNGKINPHRMIGVLPAETLSQYIDTYMGEIK